MAVKPRFPEELKCCESFCVCVIQCLAKKIVTKVVDVAKGQVFVIGSHPNTA